MQIYESIFCIPDVYGYAGLTLSNPGDLAISLGTSDTVIIYASKFFYFFKSNAI
jgi:hypothetical protein